MAFCLIPKEAEKFLEKLKNGSINPAELVEMTSAERRSFFSSFMTEENAKEVNALFESKLLLKNQQQGMINWAKRITGITKEARHDLISRINRIEKVLDPKEKEAFLQDLANKKLGVDVTVDEAKKISDLSQEISKYKEKWNEKTQSWASEDDRLKYGATKVALQDYVKELKLSAEKQGVFDYIKHPLDIFSLSTLSKLGGISKSILASLDNSFFGRQGIKVLYTNPTIWARNFYKSFGDITKELKGVDAILPIKADIFSRPNALNGKYSAGGYALGIDSEEAFPSSLAEKIPILGRFFKASESAYNGAALRIRADLADKLIKLAEEQGINTMNKDEAKGIGNLVNSLTGRGSIGKAEPLSKGLNNIFFSIKFLKSNFDVLTAHQFDPSSTPFSRKQARFNLFKIIGGMAAVLALAEALYPGSVEKDPRSSHFGKIKIGNTYHDISGGMLSLLTLATRIFPTMHNGKWGFWTINAKGQYVQLSTGKYGAATAVDIIDGFWQGKLSPFAGAARDIWDGKNYQGQKPTPSNVVKNLITPIPVTDILQALKNPSFATQVSSIILKEFGF